MIRHLLYGATMTLAACGGGTIKPIDGGADRRATVDLGPSGDTQLPIDAPSTAADAPTTVDAPATIDALTDTAPEAPTIAADLEGSWYSDAEVIDGGVTDARRRRFETVRYHEVRGSFRAGYCAETGTFTFAAGVVSFTPERTAGTGCAVASPWTETVRGTATGLAFDRGGASRQYKRSRNVAKVFATAESHNGDFAGDAALPGANAVAKADAFCNASLARPDAQTYKAVLVDGVARSALPAIDWPLLPDTTYYRADGAVNVFHTNAASLTNPYGNNGVEPSGGLGDHWTGILLDFTTNATNTCAGWTSHASGLVGRVGATVGGAFSSTVGHPCNDNIGLVCVSTGAGGGSGGPGTDGGIRDAGSDARPTATELEGAWYALGPVTDGRIYGVLHKRIRFEGDRYAAVYSTDRAYCAEVGKFQVTPAGVAFQVDYVDGFGACVERPSRVEPLTRTATGGLTLEDAGVVTSYARIRNVPKVFATVQTHNGDFASDPFLPGADAIQKADAFCDRSSAKPDNGRYRALMWDVVNRGGLGTSDWLLRPDVTYFQADGARNAFTTTAAALPQSHQPTIPGLNGVQYFWLGNGCAGWTSASTSVNGSSTDAAQPGLGGLARRVGPGDSGASCNTMSYGVLCVGDGEPLGAGGSDGGGDAGAPELQGAWRRADSPTDGAAPGDPPLQRLRFDGNRYALAWDEANAYCAEVGTFLVSPTSIRFIPERVVGLSSCVIGDDRVEALTRGAADITLARARGPARFVRADAVAKIFLTTETHDGDFLHDPHLAGANAIAKADAFCNQSAARPDGQNYKASLVDGTNRAASPAIDWVLKPIVTYFQAAGALPIFTTDAQSFHPAGLVMNRYLSAFAQIHYMWSGLTATFGTAIGTDTCQGWTVADSVTTGGGADSRSGLQNAVFTACSNGGWSLICVSQ
jgi:hypothetical protein